MTDTVLMSVTLKGFQITKRDKAQERRVESDNHATSGSAAVYKYLVSKEFMRPVDTIDGEIRRVLPKVGLATGIRGLFAVKGKRDEAERLLENLFAQRRVAVSEIVAKYDSELDRREAEMGDLFNRSDYPSAAMVESRFSEKVMVLSPPSSAGITDESAARAIDESREELFREAFYDAFDRLEEMATDIIEKMGRDFKPGTMQKVLGGLLDTLESLNLWDDPNMDDCLKLLRANIFEVSLEALKYDDQKREAALAAAKKVLQISRDAIPGAPVPDATPETVTHKPETPTPVTPNVVTETDDFSSLLD